MYIGFDISTSAIGICILDKEENLIYKDCIIFKEKIALEEKAKILENKLDELFKCYPKIKEIYVEEPFVAMFGGGSSAGTTAILNNFNGMARYVIYRSFNIIPILLSLRSARSLLEIKIPRDSKGKTKKQPIIDYISNKYSDFVYKVTRMGNPEKGVDDIADAIVMAIAGIRGLDKKE